MAKDLSVFPVVLAFTLCIFSYLAESRKELRTNKGLNQENVIQLIRARPSNTIDPSQVVELSWQPRVFMYNGFLSNEECDHLISLGTGNEDKFSGNNTTEVVEGTPSLDISLESEDEITARIQERISAWTFLPKGNGKPLHVLHSGPEDAKENHTYLGNLSMQSGQTTLATVVMYLSNVTQGGQILFPRAESGSSTPKNSLWADCANNSQITKPSKGNAILFFNLYPNTSLDLSSSHARCPITEGDMWWATKIFVVKSVTRLNSVTSETRDDDLCADEDDKCPQWAAVGECERNPIFMVGTDDYYGTCRKSCNVC